MFGAGAVEFQRGLMHSSAITLMGVEAGGMERKMRDGNLGIRLTMLDQDGIIVLVKRINMLLSTR
jgi:hypothetical protein